jgi:hypothetical protein
MKNMKKMGMKKMMKGGMKKSGQALFDKLKAAGYKQMGGEDKSMNAMQQMKYGAEKMMTKATMTGKLDKAMGGMEMMKKMMKGGESKYPKRGMRAKTNKMNRKK